MKKIWPLILVVLMVTSIFEKVAAQDSLARKYSSFNNVINVSVGYWSTDMMAVGWKGQHRQVTVVSYSGAFVASYKHRISPRAYLGFGIGYERVGGDTLRINITGRTAYTADTLGRYSRTVFSAAPELTYVYKHDPGKNFVVYGLLGAGVSYIKQEVNRENSRLHLSYPSPLPLTSITKYSKFHFNGQISPFCFKIGTGKLSGFVELGFGYKGIVCGGLALKY